MRYNTPFRTGIYEEIAVGVFVVEMNEVTAGG